MRLSTMTPSARGFDCNTTVSRDAAKRMRAAGFGFAIRYVRRTTAHTFDITSNELTNLLDAGLGVMLVQHVAAPGWVPTEALGAQYGATAAAEAALIGYMLGAHLWCDLEGVQAGASHADVIAFCNAWHGAVQDAGYHPGLYVGDSCGLTATELYRALRFDSYWSAYNLNRDNFPATRGVMLRQFAYPPVSRRVLGVPFEYDEDVVQADAMGDLPTMVVA